MNAPINGTLEDLHVHLYGCPTADDLFRVWQERSSIIPERLAWFQGEWHRLTGKIAKIDNLESLRAHYELSEQVHFAAFQARINLVIALFPALRFEDELWRLTLQSDREMTFVAYRTAIPSHLTESDQERLMLTHAEILQQRCQGRDRRVIFSLNREDLQTSAKIFLNLVDQKKITAKICMGVDFCGDEQAQMNFELFAEKIAQLQIELKKRNMDVFLHIGESWNHIGLEESLRRIEIALRTGVRYFGHLTSLWCAESFLLRLDPKNERLLQRRISLQQTLISRSIITETCQESNYLLSPGILAEELPLKVLKKSQGAQYWICRDDPGIFKVNLP